MEIVINGREARYIYARQLISSNKKLKFINKTKQKVSDIA